MTHKMAPVSRGFLLHSVGQIWFELTVASVISSISLRSLPYLLIPSCRQRLFTRLLKPFSSKSQSITLIWNLSLELSSSNCGIGPRAAIAVFVDFSNGNDCLKTCFPCGFALTHSDCRFEGEWADLNTDEVMVFRILWRQKHDNQLKCILRLLCV